MTRIFQIGGLATSKVVDYIKNSRAVSRGGVARACRPCERSERARPSNPCPIWTLARIPPPALPATPVNASLARLRLHRIWPFLPRFLGAVKSDAWELRRDRAICSFIARNLKNRDFCLEKISKILARFIAQIAMIQIGDAIAAFSDGVLPGTRAPPAPLYSPPE